MPGMSGFEVLTPPKLRYEQIMTPVLVLTGKTLSSADAGHLREGMAAVVQKNGVSIEQIVGEAKRLLLQRRDSSTAKLPRVLYVEDSAQNRDVVRRYLAGIFEVIEAEDASTDSIARAATPPISPPLDLRFRASTVGRRRAGSRQAQRRRSRWSRSPRTRAAKIGLRPRGRLRRLPDQARRPRGLDLDHQEAPGERQARERATLAALRLRTRTCTCRLR